MAFSSYKKSSTGVVDTDTFATVETATAPFTSTNGVNVVAGGDYLLLSGGATWAQSELTDTFATVETATAAFTTTNGVDVASGQDYILLSNGDTWAYTGTSNPNSNVFTSSATVIDTDAVLNNQNAVDGEHRQFSVTGTGTRPFTSTLPINLNVNGTLTSLAAGSTFTVPAGAFGYYFRVGGELWFSYQTQGIENADASNLNGAPQDLSANALSLLPDRVAWHFHVRNNTVDFSAGGATMNVTVDGVDVAVGVTSHTVPVGAQGFAVRVGAAYQVMYRTLGTSGISADADQQLTLGSDNLPYLGPEVDIDVRFVEKRCYEEPGAAIDVNGLTPYLDEISPPQLATLPAGAHMRWTAPQDIVLNTLEVARLGPATSTTISWTTSNGDSGSDTTTAAGANTAINLGSIALAAGDTIDFTLDDLTGGQMQITTDASSIANGWTALQDYSGFANGSHWSTRLIGSNPAIKHTVNVYEDTNGDTSLAEVIGDDLTDLAAIPATWTQVDCIEPDIDIDWIKEECYELPGNTYEFTTNAPVIENNGDMLQASGAVAPGNAPLRLANSGTEPIQVDTIRVRAGAVGWVALPAGNLTIGGVQYIATAYEDINATANDYRTIVFTPNAAPLVLQPGDSFTSQGNWALMTGGFQGPVSSGAGTNPPFAAGTQARAEIEYTPGTLIPGDKVTVRTYEDGSLKLVDTTANTLTDLAAIDPTWTPCAPDPVVDLYTKSIDCYDAPNYVTAYDERDAVTTGTFNLSNLETQFEFYAGPTPVPFEGVLVTLTNTSSSPITIFAEVEDLDTFSTLDQTSQVIQPGTAEYFFSMPGLLLGDNNAEGYDILWSGTDANLVTMDLASPEDQSIGQFFTQQGDFKPKAAWVAAVGTPDKVNVVTLSDDTQRAYDSTGAEIALNINGWTPCPDEADERLTVLESIQNVEVENGFLASASIPAQDVNAGTVVTLTDERTDAGWAIAANEYTYTGTPDKVHVRAQINQAIAQNVNIQRPAPMLILLRNGTPILQSATGYIRDATDHEESSNTIVFTDANPGTNPSYSLTTEQETTQGGVVTSEFGYFSCEAIEKVSVRGAIV